MEESRSKIDRCGIAPASFLQRAFCIVVLLVALWRFSENSADPDLWGHVTFGQRMIRLGEVETTEPFSWTAPGYRWINHEIGAEIIMGGTHLLLGGPGLLLLALVTGFFTFGMALRMGSQKLEGPQTAFAWAVALLAAKEIAFGFAVRPQIFTGVAIILTLFALRKVHEQKFRWAVLLPILFLAWINTHGGALAGFCIVAAATMATTTQMIWKRFIPRDFLNFEMVVPQTVITLAFVTILCLGALFLNPYGAELIQWLIGSILWFRPEISEWNPPAVGTEHAGMFALVVISLFSLLFSRRKKWLWEVGIVLALAFVSLRHERHIPLFSIATLAIVPPHLVDAVSRFKNHLSNLTSAFQKNSIRISMAVLLIGASVALIALTLTSDKRKFYTIEVPGEDYPLAAIKFIRDHEIRGKMISFFDWGEQCIWELPDSQVSIDGRLDTCYPRTLLREHWNFYDARPVDKNIFNYETADFALLRVDIVGSVILEKNPNWKVVYRDPLSVVFVRNIERFPKLSGIQTPITNSREISAQRLPFPSAPSQSAEVK